MIKIIKDIVIVLVIFGAGIVPCILLFPVCILFFASSLLGTPPTLEWYYQVLLFIASSAGATGIWFFITAIVSFCCKKPWRIFNYIIGIYSLIGAIIAIIIYLYLTDEILKGSSDSEMGNIQFELVIPYYCMLSIIALVIAYLTRHKKRELVNIQP